MTAPDHAAVERRFPVLQPRLGGPKESIPWGAIAPHERQAQRNHYQTLKQLAGRGGLSWCEMAAVMEDRDWRSMPEGAAKAAVLAIVAHHTEPTP